MRKRGVLFVLGLIAIFFFMAGGFGEADGTCYWEGNVEICSSIGYGEGPFRYLCGGPGERCCLGAGMQCWAGGVCVGGYCQQDCGYSFFDPESGFINYYCCINGLGFYCNPDFKCDVSPWWPWNIRKLPFCVNCGESEQPCCPGKTCKGDQDHIFCGADNKCHTCGYQDMVCCPGGKCDAGLTCLAAPAWWCVSGGLCGNLGNACCYGENCVDGSYCNINGNCVESCGYIGEICCFGGSCYEGECTSSGICSSCGGNGESCCYGDKCDAWNLICNAGEFPKKCRPCGAENEKCCSSYPFCNPGLLCDQFAVPGGVCKTDPGTCGKEGIACCPGSKCFDGLVCDETGICRGSCGEIGEPCCLGGYCDGCTSCGSDLYCQACINEEGCLFEGQTGCTQYLSATWTCIDTCAGAAVCLHKQITPCGQNESCFNGNCISGCAEGANRPCYTGPAGTENIGECHSGAETCSENVWGVCVGDQTPQTEICCNNLDEDCDGQVDENCGPRFCYQETADVADACSGLSTGSYSCNNSWWSGNCLYIQDGDWGTFAGAVPPGAVFASSYYNVSYSVPPNKKPQALEFKYEYYSYDVGDNQNYLENLTNIEACVNSGKVQFSFQIDAGNSIGELYCYNQSGKWDKLTDFFGDGSGWAVGIYEERLWWNCTEGAMSVCNDNGTCDAGETAENCPSDCSAEEESCILAWQKNFSSAGNAADFAMSIISDSSGSLYAAGSGVNINSASSGSDWWIMKLNSADGSRIWDKNFSSSGSYGDFANSLIQDLSGNSLYVAGYGNNLNSASSGEDWWIMKLNSADGSRIWDKNFSWDGRDRANSISKGLQEEIYVVGDSGLGSNSDFRVVRLNSTGVQNWSVAFSSSIDWGFSSAYGFESLYVAGYKGGTGWWVMRINITNGNKIWESTFAGGPGAYATTVALDDSNNIYVGGYGLNLASPTSNWDWWIMKLNATNGSRIWDKNFSTSDDSADIAYSISIDSSGNLYAVGTGKNLTTTNSNWDWWIMKLNTLNGNKIWEMNFSSQIGSSPDAPYYISYDSFGNIYIAGYGSQLARVPPNPSGGDWWIMKLDCGGGPRGCTPGEKKSCYTGPAGTNGTGICRNGNQTCMADGTWNGTCVGQVTPLGSEICFGEYDEDCDGDIDCNDTNCFGTQWCPEVECPFVLSFPCVDSRGNDVECTVSNCWEIDFMNANSQEKQAYCENCPIETGDECIWVNGGCRRKGAIEGCYQQIKENENCGPSDPTHQIVYSWYNVTTLAYSLNCEEDDCGDNPGCVVNIPCSSVLKLNYFEIGNLIAVVLILVIIYWMWMRYGSRKVGKAKRKRKEG